MKTPLLPTLKGGWYHNTSSVYTDAPLPGAQPEPTEEVA